MKNNKFSEKNINNSLFCVIIKKDNIYIVGENKW